MGDLQQDNSHVPAERFRMELKLDGLWYCLESEVLVSLKTWKADITSFTADTSTETQHLGFNYKLYTTAIRVH